MAKYISGVYTLLDNGVIAVTRKVIAADEGDGSMAALAKAAQKDRVYMVLENPQIEVGEAEDVTTFITGYYGSIHPAHCDFDSGVHYIPASYCEECKGPQVDYPAMLAYGHTKCVWCHTVFSHVRPHPNDALGLARLIDKGEARPDILVTPDYDLPYGFPTPKLIDLPTAIKYQHMRFTEHEGLDIILPEFDKLLSRGKNASKEDQIG